MDAEIRSLPKMRVAGFRHVGPYNQIGPVEERLMQWVRQNGIQSNGNLAIWLDDPKTTPEAELRSDALAIVEDDFESTDEGVVVYDIPAASYAVVTHVGDYSGLPDAWNRFMGESIAKSGLQMGDGFFFEKYLDDCSQVSPDQVRTELYAPVKV